MRLWIGAGLLSLAVPALAADPLTGAPSQFATVDGLKVHYKVLGRGEPTLVLVHGWTCNLGFWKAQAPLAQSLRVLFVDLPGHGKSDAPPRTYSMQLMARGVEAAMRAAGVDKGVLVGHSMGTVVIWQLSRLFPEKALALVAVDGSFRNPFKTQEERERWASRDKGQDYKTALAARLDGLIGTTAPAALRAEIKAEMLKTPEHVATSAAYEMTDPIALSPDPPIELPVLGVYADYWPANYKAEIARFIPKLDYRLLAGAGHFLMMEKPAEFDDILLGWLRQQVFPRPQ
jgi:pimeloyl-ACP methyl ester carboxylesterase